MAFVGNAFNIPHFISAQSPQALRVKLLENNLRDKMEYQYFSIGFDGKNWVAWFYKEASEKPKLVKK